MITIIPEEQPIPKLHQYLLGSIGPRPICFASTIDADGRPNLAPFSFFNVVSANPPIVVFSPARSGRDGTTKHTHDNVKEVPEVVVNIINYPIVEKMNVAAAPWDKGISEFEKAGFTPLKSETVRPFRVAECPVQMECRVLEVKEFGTGGAAGNLIIAQVQRIHIKEEMLDADGRIDQKKMDLVGRMGGSWYCRATPDNMFQLPQPMHKGIGYDQLPEHIRNSKKLSANHIGMLCNAESMPDADEIQLAVKSAGTVADKEDAAIQMLNAGKVREALCLLLSA